MTPQYRIEQYLNAINAAYLGDSPLPEYPSEPVWRIEGFLAAILSAVKGDSPVMACPDPAWRIEEFARAVYDALVGASPAWPCPTPASSLEVFLHAIYAMVVDGTEEGTPTPSWDIESWLVDVYNAAKEGSGEEKTVSGVLIHITDALAKAALAVEVAITPTQDLHGYANPWPAGGGKNLANTIEENIIYKNGGSAFTLSFGDGSITMQTTTFGALYCLLKIFEISADHVGKSFVFSFTGTAGTVRIVLCDSDGNNRVEMSSPYTIQAADVGKVITLRFYNQSSADMTWSNIQLEQGSSATSYAPYSNICPISGLTGLTVYRTGVNVWDEEWELGAFNNSTGAKSASSNTIRSKNPIAIRPETEYCFVSNNAVYLYFYDANGDFLPPYEYKAVSGGKVNFTSPQNACYLNFYSYGTSYSQNKSINYPSTDTDYHAYNGNTYAVDWTSQAGTVYHGTVDPVTGQLTVDMASVDLGSINWTYESGYTYPYFIGTMPNDCVVGSDVQGQISVLFSIYESIQNIGASEFRTQDRSFQCCLNSNVSTRRLLVQNPAYTDAATFKTAMNGVQLVYDLETPVTYQLTPQEVQMLLGENYVWSSSGDSLSVTYMADGNATPLQALNIMLGSRYVNPGTAEDVSDAEALDILLGR